MKISLACLQLVGRRRLWPELTASAHKALPHEPPSLTSHWQHRQSVSMGTAMLDEATSHDHGVPAKLDISFSSPIVTAHPRPLGPTSNQTSGGCPDAEAPSRILTLLLARLMLVATSLQSFSRHLCMHSAFRAHLNSQPRPLALISTRPLSYHLRRVFLTSPLVCPTAKEAIHHFCEGIQLLPIPRQAIIMLRLSGRREWNIWILARCRPFLARRAVRVEKKFSLQVELWLGSFSGGEGATPWQHVGPRSST